MWPDFIDFMFIENTSSWYNTETTMDPWLCYYGHITTVHDDDKPTDVQTQKQK